MLPSENSLIAPEPPPIPEDLNPFALPPLAPRRIPNLAHAFLFIAFTGLLLILLQLTLSAIGKAPATLESGVVTVKHPILQLGVMAGTYLATLLAASLIFPLLWHRSFLNGIQWNFAAARTQASRLIGLGLILGLTMAVVTRFISSPKSIPVDQFFANAAIAWLITLFGTVVAPIFEEICFRGFLVPAFAIAYDWIALPRTPEARLRWQSTITLTPAAYIFAAVVSSFFFALIHAQQVAHLWAALISLFTISLVLTFVRVKTQSVAASALVHSAYNSFIFLSVIFATGGYRHLDRMTH
jgi:membrane protease YdiL (CAAX protease family)